MDRGLQTGEAPVDRGLQTGEGPVDRGLQTGEAPVDRGLQTGERLRIGEKLWIDEPHRPDGGKLLPAKGEQ